MSDLIPRMPRRRHPSRAHIGMPSFLTAHSDVKQVSRDVVAQAFKNYFEELDRLSPLILVLPHYDLLCARTIRKTLPKARFVAVERSRAIAEEVSELSPGEKIPVYAMDLHRYIDYDPDGRKFDGAFLDYSGYYSKRCAESTIAFAQRRLRPNGMLAVTSQGTLAVCHAILADLKNVIAGRVEMVCATEYHTKVAMCLSIFLIEKE